MDRLQHMGKGAQTEGYLAAIMEAASDAVIVTDEKGIIERINPAAMALFGYESAEMLGSNVSMLMPAPHREQHDAYMNRYLQTGEKRVIGVGRNVDGRRRDGSVFPLRLAVSEVKMEGKSIFAAFLHDLTDVKTAEKEISRLNAELTRQNELLEEKVEERTEKLARVLNELLENNHHLNREVEKRQRIEQVLRQREQQIQQTLEKERQLSEMKTRFISTASHEFRTPLSSILSSAEILGMYSEQENNARMFKHVSRIKTSVSMLTGILNDFLSLSKLDENKVSVEPETIDLDTFCAQIFDEIRGLFKPGQTVRHRHEGPGQIRTDKKILRNLLFNLLTNAIKYSPENSVIDCTTRYNKQALQLEIHDQGIGIPLQDQPHVFDNFFRASNVENIEGTGLGLAIARRYVSLLGGSIRFSSDEGIGTTFTVILPV